jgi:hypothetical protein
MFLWGGAMHSLMVAGDQVWLWIPAALISGPRAAPLIYEIKLIAVE